MHIYLLVLKIPKRWYLPGDVLFAAIGQAGITWRSREESIWSGEREDREGWR
jgi:hypothetical protein